MPTSKTLSVFDALAGRPPSANFAQLDVRNDHIVLDFDDTAAESIDFCSVLPQDYAGGNLRVVVTWAATSATTGDVVWQAEFERHHIDDSTLGTHDLDNDDFGAAATASTATSTSAGELMQTIIDLPATDADNPAAGESFRLRVSRVATSGSDTMTDDAELVAVELREV